MSPTDTLSALSVGLIGPLALWRLVVLLRSPHPTRARVTAVLLLWTAFLSNVLRIRSVRMLVDGVIPQLSSLLANIALIFFFFGFLVFFGASLRPSSFTRVKVQLAIAACAVVAMTVTWAAATEAGAVLEFGGLVPGGPVAALYFFLIVQIYFGYGCAGSALLAARAARSATPTGRVAFGTCTVGLVVILVSGPAMRLPAVIGALANLGRPPASVQSVALPFLTAGGFLVAVGLCTFAARSTAVRVRLWLQAKRMTLALDPLWRALHGSFGGIGLHPSRSRLREVMRLRRVFYHSRRRLVEVRDGLLQLSPYIVDPDDGSDDRSSLAAQAELVHAALERRARGEPPTRETVAVAVSSSDDDGSVLVALAEHFGAVESRRSSPRPFRSPALR